MKFDLSSEEFKTLLKALFLADYMIAGHDSNMEQNFDKLKNKILKIALQNNFTKYCEEYEKGELDFSFLPDEYEDIDQVIDEYDHDNFWETLIDNLAQRDLHKKMNPDEYQKLSIKTKLDLIQKHREIYEIEFEKNGVENLRLLNPNLPF